MDNEQKEKLAKLIAEFGALKSQHMSAEAEYVHDEILEILYPEESKKEQKT